ncbi:MAG: ABC transporter substrate-binding protein [Chloroflexi bacterium]|nr:ABC transporter substrate-binding protein [Chloroflexota bacterium]
MFRRTIAVVLIVLMVLGGWHMAPTLAQEDNTIMVLAAAESETPVMAWLDGFAAQNPDFSFVLSLFGDDASLAENIAGADLLVYPNFEDAPPIDFECGTISRAYVLLPDLGARYLASTDCGDVVSPKTPIMVDLLKFMVSPDGQQIAIDLGLLPNVIEVTDQGGVTVQVPQPVRHIASAYGVATYYAYVVGAADRIVAASYIGAKGPAVQDTLRKIDPGFDARFNAMSALNQNEINLEEVAALQTDLILSSARAQWLDSAAELGIPILRFEGETPERLIEAMTVIGAALGPDAAYRAAQFNAYYQQVLEQISAEVTQLNAAPAKVYFSGTEPLRVASGEMYQSEMIELAGGVSVGAELTGFWNDVNLEQIAVWDPDVIFVPTYGGASVEAITGAAEWGILRAVQDGKVYQLPQFISPWDTPLPDSILGIIWMAETLHEGLDLGCEDQASYFYNEFYGYNISDEETMGLCN